MRSRPATVAVIAVLAAAAGSSLLFVSEEPAPQPAVTPIVKSEPGPGIGQPTVPRNARAPAGDTDCDRPEYPPFMPAEPPDPFGPEEQRTRELEAIATRLSASSDPEHLLTAAMLGGHADRSTIAAFERAYQADPDHALVLWLYLDACARQPSAAECDGNRIERRAIAVDGRNGALWARIAASRSREGDTVGALAAVRQAAAVPEYDDKWAELVRLLERSLAASSSLSYPERVFAAFGGAGAVLGEAAVLASACGEMAAETEWQYACLAFGERLEHESRTLLFSTIGLGIQSAVYRTSGDTRAQSRVDQRLRENRELLTEHGRIESLLWRDENVLSDYLMTFETHGERAAAEFLREEAGRRKALPGPGLCNPS